MNISLPIHLLTIEEMETLGTAPPPPPPKPTDMGMVVAKRNVRPPLRIKVDDPPHRPTVQDLSPRVRSSRRKPVEREFIHCRFCPCDLPVNSNLCEHFERCACGRIQYSYVGLVESDTLPHRNDAEFSYCCPAPAFLTPRSSESSTERLFNSSIEKPFNSSTERSFNIVSAVPSPLSLRGKVVYPSMRKIPADLPCHERYTALSRSRSTKALESQKVWPVSWTVGDDRFATKANAGDDDAWEDDVKDDDARSVKSSGSSVYSQESDETPVSEWEYAVPR
jgi:hypothetical protein